MYSENWAMLKTSRTPAREALRRLSTEGLVTLCPRCHAEVTLYSEDMVQHIGYVRLALDIMASQLAVYYGSDADFQELIRLADLCEAAFATGNLYNAIVADRNFHLAIATISKNDILMRYSQATYLRLHLLQLQFSILLDEHDKRQGFHQIIIDCLRRRDSISLASAIMDRYTGVYHLEPRIVALFHAEGKRTLADGQI